MYPLKLVPIYQERIWGGRRLQSLFSRKLPPGLIGESWELSGHSHGVSQIANGPWAGKSLNELVASDASLLLGHKYESALEFPLLIKIIDASEDLSVQVHPDDSYAKKVENSAGKAEAWYVFAAEEQASIIYGLKAGTTESEFEQALASDLDQVLCKRSVQAGDMIYVPPGTVHALGSGIVVYEVQQSSDITYRLYDYDRTDSLGRKRPLQIEKARAVLSFPQQSLSDFFHDTLATPHFTMEKIHFTAQAQLASEDVFIILCILEGVGSIRYEQHEISFMAGETILIPASIAAITFTKPCTALKISG